MRIVIITGMSGAGKSTALDSLEDAGFEAVDNIPLSLVPLLVMPLSDAALKDRPSKLAVGVDVRSRDFSQRDLLTLVERLRDQPDTQPTLIFLDCQDDILAARFSETRRRHPLAQDRPVADGITEERERLALLRDEADHLIDTSGMKTAELRQQVRILISDEAQGLTVCVTSFSYARGLPRNADIVMDVRFLHNPHYEDTLRPLTGRDGRVGEYIRKDREYTPFWEKMQALLKQLLPRYAAEGKSYLTIAFGCTGGKHRSVFLTEQCAAWLQDAGYPAIIQHRDIPEE